MQEIYIHPDAFEGKARTYRPQRARARTRPKAGGCTKRPEDWLRAAQVKMEEDSPSDPVDSEPGGLIERTSLCLPNYEKDIITHLGDEGFQDALRQYFPSSESNATERLVDLKARLKKASTHDFWAILMEEMCDITGAQCSFVAKRMLVDDQDSAVEMPPLGEPGSCLMGVAFYIDNGTDVKKLYRDYRYYAYGTPCAHMKHDKVFIVPEKISEVCPNNPNAKNLPFTSEAFIGVPLFVDGKPFAHFCLIYSKEGASKRKLSWSYLEMFMHTLEDMIVQRVLEGRGFAKDNSLQPTQKPLIPLSAIAASQSLKPYARSLSHELRTPMQGVIGMLDIMYSTVQEAIETQDEPAAKLIFTDLKGHIEVVQESSKRAVEAADNVVHAYDMNMEMPESPLSSDDETPLEASHSPAQTDAFQRTNTKRKFSLSLQSRREPSEEVGFHPGPPLKKMFTMTEGDFEDDCYKQQPTPTSAGEVSMSGSMMQGQLSPGESYFSRRNRNPPPPTMSPTRRRIFIRDFMRTLVHDTLRGGHPTSEVCIQTALGETIEVQTQGPRGEVQERLIHLKVEQEVPIVIITEEQHLYFSLQKIVDNAVKFTETGTITITVRMGRNALIEIWVVDTGCGITQESQEHLFTPHFQEDASLSRSRDGLGLSLFNAKAHVRRNLGGDVTLERSATEGNEKGSSFLIRLPIISTTEMPFLVTPTSANAQIEPFPEMRLPPAAVQDFSASSKIALGASPTKVSSRKRIPFNPNLAKDYPLKFLIAEDNAINRSVAVASLAKLGYDKKDITLAFDGVEAVNHYNNSLSLPLSERFNVILMDIWMPNMDGYEATTKIRDLANRSGDMANIIAVTADITSGCIDRAREVGMHRFLAKPYKVFDIENMIKEQFSR